MDKQNPTNYVGIDISKPFFDVALRDGKRYRHYKVGNNQAGFSDLIKVLPSESITIMEVWPLLSQAGKFPDREGNSCKCC
jgi:hypothetical protein